MVVRTETKSTGKRRRLLDEETEAYHDDVDTGVSSGSEDSEEQLDDDSTTEDAELTR
jgi:hypothetical protein